MFHPVKLISGRAYQDVQILKPTHGTKFKEAELKKDCILVDETSIGEKLIIEKNSANKIALVANTNNTTRKL